MNWSYGRYVREQNEAGERYLRQLKRFLLICLALWLSIVAMVMLFIFQL